MLNEKSKFLFTFLMLFSAITAFDFTVLLNVALAEDAPAASSIDTDLSSLTGVICQAVEAIMGPIGKTIAVLVILSMAIMLFLGKVSWGLAIMVAVGMGVLFGAKDLVKFISKSSTDICA